MIATIRGAGFDVVDASGMVVTEQHQGYLEDDNLMHEPAHLAFRRRVDDRDRGIVADIAVGQQIFNVHGEWSRAEELRHLVEGRESDRRAN
jgi:hypothetical protein